MINPTTLILATLVFNLATVFGAPIRIPTAPEVVIRAVADPILPRVEVVDLQPEFKRSVDGGSSRLRFARETEYPTRDTASSEPVEARSSLPEVDKTVRSYPRGILYDFYERRSPEPEPSPAPAPSDMDTPAEVYRRFPRRVYQELYTKRSEPAQEEARSEPEPELTRRFPREALAKRYAEPSTSNEEIVSRDPAPEVAPVVTEELVRRFPRRAAAELFEKRQEEPPVATPTDAPTDASPPTSSSTTTVPAPASTLTSTTTTTGILPGGASLDQALAAAISNKGTTNISVELKVSHQGPPVSNEAPKAACKDAPPASPSGTPTAKSEPSPTASSSSTASPAASAASGSEAPANEGSATTPGSPSPPVDAGKSADGTTAAAAASPSPSPAATDAPVVDGADGGATPPAEGSPAPLDSSPSTPSSRDLGDDQPQPIVRRSGGLSGALLATWYRRNVSTE